MGHRAASVAEESRNRASEPGASRSRAETTTTPSVSKAPSASPKRPQRRRDTEASRGGSAPGVTGVTPAVVVIRAGERATSDEFGLERCTVSFVGAWGLIAVFTIGTSIRLLAAPTEPLQFLGLFSQPAQVPVDLSSRTHLQNVSIPISSERSHRLIDAAFWRSIQIDGTSLELQETCSASSQSAPPMSPIRSRWRAWAPSVLWNLPHAR